MFTDDIRVELGQSFDNMNVRPSKELARPLKVIDIIPQMRIGMTKLVRQYNNGEGLDRYVNQLGDYSKSSPIEPDLWNLVEVGTENVLVDADDLVCSAKFLYQAYPCQRSFANVLYLRRCSCPCSFWPAALNQRSHFAHVFGTSCDVPKGRLVQNRPLSICELLNNAQKTALAGRQPP